MLAVLKTIVLFKWSMKLWISGASDFEALSFFENLPIYWKKDITCYKLLWNLRFFTKVYTAPYTEDYMLALTRTEVEAGGPSTQLCSWINTIESLVEETDALQDLS